MSQSEENEPQDEGTEPESTETPEDAVPEAPDAAEAPETGEPQPTPETAAAEQADPAPQEGEEDGRPAEPEAPSEPDAEAEPEPEAATEESEPEPEPEASSGAEDAPEAGSTPEPARAPEVAKSESGSGKQDVVPGANLEPIAISEERELTAEEKARREAEQEERARRDAVASDRDEEELPRREVAAVPTDLSIQATGKRKSSIARVVVRPGSGTIEVNGKGLDEYFPRPQHQTIARQPLLSSGYDSNLEVKVRVHGGGVSGQAGAVRHGIARALVELDPELRADLKKRGMLTRDAREKERRKAGLKKARKRPQFSKR